jgi:DNA polymerase-1
MEYRELAKLKNTYIDTLPKLVGNDGRLHTSFDQLGASTGRLSSKNPNLQNIPIKNELGREIRKAFVAERGNKILSADYSQIELRVVASLAQDKNMIEAFQQGKDIHALTAAEIFNIPLEKVTNEQRKAAKVLNFGVIYGMSVHGFAQAAGVEASRAKAFIEKYFQEFDGVARYIEKTKETAATLGYVQTLFGRKRFIPEINSSAWNLRAAAERMAINMPIQGTAADLIKMAMVEINQKLKTNNLKLLLQVHDELVFEVPESEVIRAAGDIKKIMENIYSLAVPLTVEMESGDSWGGLKKITNL